MGEVEQLAAVLKRLNAGEDPQQVRAEARRASGVDQPDRSLHRRAEPDRRGPQHQRFGGFVLHPPGSPQRAGGEDEGRVRRDRLLLLHARSVVSQVPGPAIAREEIASSPCSRRPASLQREERGGSSSLPPRMLRPAAAPIRSRRAYPLCPGQESLTPRLRRRPPSSRSRPCDESAGGSAPRKRACRPGNSPAASRRRNGR